METGFCPERLKNIREERGLNKAEAARLFGLSKMGYLRYETAARTPSWQTIVFMAQKLGTTPEYLTGASEIPEPAEYLGCLTPQNAESQYWLIFLRKFKFCVMRIFVYSVIMDLCIYM